VLQLFFSKDFWQSPSQSRCHERHQTRPECLKSIKEGALSWNKLLNCRWPYCRILPMLKFRWDPGRRRVLESLEEESNAGGSLMWWSHSCVAPRNHEWTFWDSAGCRSDRPYLFLWRMTISLSVVMVVKAKMLRLKFQKDAWTLCSCTSGL